MRRQGSGHIVHSKRHTTLCNAWASDRHCPHRRHRKCAFAHSKLELIEGYRRARLDTRSPKYQRLLLLAEAYEERDAESKKEESHAPHAEDSAAQLAQQSRKSYAPPQPQQEARASPPVSPVTVHTIDVEAQPVAMSSAPPLAAVADKLAQLEQSHEQRRDGKAVPGGVSAPIHPVFQTLRLLWLLVGAALVVTPICAVGDLVALLGRRRVVVDDATPSPLALTARGARSVLLTGRRRFG